MIIKVFSNFGAFYQNYDTFSNSYYTTNQPYQKFSHSINPAWGARALSTFMILAYNTSLKPFFFLVLNVTLTRIHNLMGATIEHYPPAIPFSFY